MKRAFGKRRKRRYYYKTNYYKRNISFVSIFILLITMLLFSAFLLLHYFSEAKQEKHIDEVLRTIYYEQEDAAQANDSDEAFILLSYQEDEARKKRLSLLSSAQLVIQADTLQSKKHFLSMATYPLNPYKTILARFTKLQRENKDIIGWLNIPDLVDQAVVQRNNTYYLSHDAMGNNNTNGALFLDEACDLSTRPYTMIIYGHNMKNGNMFGNLRKYEKLSFYQSHAVFTFDSLYEEGEYAVFAVSRISTVPKGRKYINIRKLSVFSVEDRNQEINKLIQYSVFTNHIDVQPEDQLLLLVTCGTDENERLVVAARRLREKEQAEDMDWPIQLSKKKAN